MNEENSICIGQQLHNFVFLRKEKEGITEVCKKCHMQKYFPLNVSNIEYLSYHIRSALPKHHPRFHKEYASTTTTD